MKPDGPISYAPSTLHRNLHPLGPTDDTPTVFALTQVGVTPESDPEGPSSESVGNELPSVELPQVPETSPEDSPRAQARIDGRGTFSDGGLWQRWRGRRRPREPSSVADTNQGMWRPNTRAASEWFPVPGRTVFRVDPSHLTAAAAAVTAAGDSRRDGGAARSAGIPPASKSKECGTRCPPAVTHVVQASTLGIDQLSENLDTTRHPTGGIQARANMWTPVGVRSAGINSKGSGLAYTGLPRATDPTSEAGGSPNIEWGGSSSAHSRANMARRNKGNVSAPNGWGSRSSSNHSGASSWSSMTKVAGANATHTSPVGVDGRVCTPEHGAQHGQYSARSPGISPHRLPVKLKLREPGSRDDSQSTRGSTAPIGIDIPNRRKDNTLGLSSVQMHQNTSPFGRSNYSSRRGRSSVGKLKGRASQRGRAPGGASNGHLQGSRAKFACRRKNTKETAGDASSVVSARLDNLSLHSELSYSSWNAIPAAGVKGRTVL